MATLNDAEGLSQLIDLRAVAGKAAENHGWDDQQAAYGVKWYLAYLYLCRENRGRPIAAISKAGDDVWHQHLIDTRKYDADCEILFGQRLDHQPIYGEPTEEDNRVYADSVELYRSTFGEIPSDVGQTSGNYSYSPGLMP